MQKENNLDILRNKKILYLFEYFPPYGMGGAEISGKIRLKKLAQDNKIIAITPNYNSLNFETKRLKDYTLIRFPSFRFFLFKNRKKISHKIIKKDKKSFSFLLLIFNIISGYEFKYWIWKTNKKYGTFNFLHGNNTESNIGVAFSKISAKKIGHLRDSIIFEQIYSKKEPIRKFIYEKLKSCIIKKMTTNINTFYAISFFIKKKFTNIFKISSQRIIVSYNDIEKSQICDCSKKKAREKLGLNNNKKYILFVGSLSKRKGVDFLIKEVAPKIKNAFLLIVGEGYLREELEKYSLNNVKIIGFVQNDKVKYYYKSADIVVVPSVWDEPWGRVSAEAQGNKTFTVVNNKGGLPETIKKDKGKIVNNKDLADFLNTYFSQK